MSISPTTTKVLINACYGGFQFSREFREEFKKRHPEKADIFSARDWDLSTNSQRTDKDVISLFEEWGTEKSSALYSELRVREVKTSKLPYLHITEYDGKEGISIDYQLAYAKILAEFFKKSEEPNFDAMAEIKALKAKVNEIIM
jgi:hypothetical protein